MSFTHLDDGRYVTQVAFPPSANARRCCLGDVHSWRPLVGPDSRVECGSFLSFEQICIICDGRRIVVENRAAPEGEGPPPPGPPGAGAVLTLDTLCTIYHVNPDHLAETIRRLKRAEADRLVAGSRSKALAYLLEALGLEATLREIARHSN